MPAVDCDLDHMKRWADGGPTTKHNLAPACPHDNLLKERHRWTYHRLPNGDYQWTSKLGHTCTTSENPRSGSGGLCPRPPRLLTTGKRPQRHRSLDGDQRAHGEWDR